MAARGDVNFAPAAARRPHRKHIRITAGQTTAQDFSYRGPRNRLMLASAPAANRSLILFAIVSSVVHAAIMAVQSVQMPEHMGHLYGDVPALLLVALVLWVLLPPAAKPQVASAAAV